MKQAFVLVDYDNQREGRYRGLKKGGVDLNVRDHQDFVDGLVRSVLLYRESDLDTKELLEVRIRLYGGWVDLNGETTIVADMVSKAIRQLGRSQRIRDTRLIVELSDRPLSGNSDALLGMHRPMPFKATLTARVDRPSGCTGATPKCLHVASAVAWETGRCPAHPACQVRRDEAFAFEGQKMVDTMIVADSLFAHYLGAVDVVTCSSDDDIIPGLLVLAALRGDATLLRFGMRNRGRFDVMLERSGVRILDRPAIG
jgi:hypothetical protein